MAPLIKPMGKQMQIRLLVARATVNSSQDRGDVIEADDAEAIRMIEAGQAEPVRGAEPELAVRRAKMERASK